METQDEEFPMCSSSSSLPQSVGAENQMHSQVNEITASEKRRLTSKAWRHFKAVRINGNRYGICKYCNARIKSDRICGTSSMFEHFDRCKKKPANLEEGGSGGEDGNQQNYFDQDISRRELAHAIILHEYPLSIVDHVGFRKFVASLQPMFKMVSRNTIKNDILKIFDNLKAKTSKLIETISSRIAITTDMWTSDNNKKGFMAITAHFIDDSWKLQSHILRFIYVPAPHESFETSSSIYTDLVEGDRLSSFDRFVASSMAYVETRSELDLYLEESLIPRTPTFDSLSWWKTNGLKFPILQKMARDLLAIPVSTVASESAFSTSGRLISPHRSRLHPNTLEALMCTRTWLWNEINGLNSTIDQVSCPTLLDEEEDPDSSGLTAL